MEVYYVCFNILPAWKFNFKLKVAVMEFDFGFFNRDTMNTSSDERFTVLSSIGEEFIYEHDLSVLLEKKPDPICYVWFEPSLTMDIEQVYQPKIYSHSTLEWFELKT